MTESKYTKERFSRSYNYIIPLEIEGVKFNITMSRSQLLKIGRNERCRLHIDVEKVKR